jgi:peptidyl-tRNA hydrolase ICT1
MRALQKYIPKALINGLLACRYYSAKSDSIQIDCDAKRDRTENKNETHRKLHDMIKKIYKDRIPGISSPEQQSKVDKL